MAVRQILLVFLLFLAANETSASPDLQRALEPIVQYFNSQQLIPIVIPRAQQIGNVYDLDSKRFLHTQKDCFPNLQYQTTPSSLPDLSTNSNESGLLSIGLPLVADTTFKANIEQVVSIGFTNVQVQFVPEAELKRRYDAVACPELSVMLQGGSSSWFQRTVLVIGELYSGRRLVTLELTEGVNVAARIKILTTLLAARGVAVEVSAGTDASGKSRVLIKSTTSFPLAFRPAFLPHPISGVTMGASSSGTPGEKKVRWEAYDRDLPSNISILKQLDAEILRSASEGSLP
jgi:hypothetical protein